MKTFLLKKFETAKSFAVQFLIYGLILRLVFEKSIEQVLWMTPLVVVGVMVFMYLCVTLIVAVGKCFPNRRSA